ncbi:BhlA/UviB family holin-like peptide [Alkaliphilus peptidifermentans]|uniref:BhlA holin family protein n=1 Tax=Alkaliphilus peptidifermentans DSM 18978 TaxID=1120976 RepID=A0A1G5JLB1_9FIRM|nr:BhlA/UviB family holin-like peptide [Alkaliphilus peptidifermentans]SCY88680.1 BhlA holin family protein [Alkaliphilus peptidifermentans DSM 18978]
MENFLVTLAQSQGLWAALFIFLFLHQIKENKQARVEAAEREDKLINFITNMSANFESLAAQYKNLAKDVDYIKTKVAENPLSK